MVSVSERFGIPRTSVTGSMLQNPRFVNKNVRLIGSVIKNHGESVEVNSGDNVNVVVKFSQPLDEPVEGLIDVQGKVTARNVIQAESYIAVPPHLAESFDLATHCEAITFIASSDNPWSHEDS